MIRMELSERLLNDDNEDYHHRQDRSPSFWWNGGEAVDDTSILEMGQDRKQGFFCERDAGRS